MLAGVDWLAHRLSKPADRRPAPHTLLFFSDAAGSTSPIRSACSATPVRSCALQSTQSALRGGVRCVRRVLERLAGAELA